MKECRTKNITKGLLQILNAEKYANTIQDKEILPITRH